MVITPPDYPDYRDYYDLERYVSETVRHRFQQDGYLSAFDFFCIVIWKANRAKSKIADKLLRDGPKKYTDLDSAVKDLTRQIGAPSDANEKMKVLVQEWKFRLRMASAILTILYPENFTVYDARVSRALQELTGRSFHNLSNSTAFDTIWMGYQEFKEQVQRLEAGGVHLASLRDKDRYLWGKSFHDRLNRDIRYNFQKIEE